MAVLMKGKINTIMNNSDFKFLSRSEEETLQFGRSAAKYVYPGLTVLLSGDLGTGKTVFVRGLGDAMEVQGVRSPSFTIVNEYSGVIPIAHIDLYRLSSGSSEDVDLEFYMANKYLILIEWPEQIFQEVKEDCWHLSFSMIENDSAPYTERVNSRSISLRALGKRAYKQLRSFAEQLSREVLHQ